MSQAGRLQLVAAVPQGSIVPLMATVTTWV
jgi:hypothetical protein